MDINRPFFQQRWAHELLEVKKFKPPTLKAYIYSARKFVQHLDQYPVHHTGLRQHERARVIKYMDLLLRAERQKLLKHLLDVRKSKVQRSSRQSTG